MNNIEKSHKSRAKHYLEKKTKKVMLDGKKQFKESKLKIVKHANEKIRSLIYAGLDGLIPKQHVEVCLSLYENHSKLGWNIYTTNRQGVYVAVLHIRNSIIADEYVHLLTESGLPAKISWNPEKDTHAIQVIIDLRGEKETHITIENLKKVSKNISEYYEYYRKKQ